MIHWQKQSISCIAHIPFSTSFFGLPSVPLAGLALGVVCGFNDKSLIDGKLSRAASLSDILTFVFLFIELYFVLFRFVLIRSFVVRVSECIICWCFGRIHLKYKDDKCYLLFWLYNQLFLTQINKYIGFGLTHESYKSLCFACTSDVFNAHICNLFKVFWLK